MPRGKWIDRKTAQHFTLVHRPQNDPLIHDESAPSMVLNPTELPNAHKHEGKHLDDLASELGGEALQIRANEGEAANYGVYFDDTEYDYMQHLREPGAGGEVVFVPAEPTKKEKGKGKQKQQSLDVALRQLDIDAEERKKTELFGDDMLPSKNLQHLTYQDQQDVPDAIRGFQPDMDPRVREVLEALEDDDFVDDGENDADDLFKELAKDGHEIDEDEFDELADDGWETDDTVKASRETRAGASKTSADDGDAPELVPVLSTEEEEEARDTVDWMENFNQFKKDQKAGTRPLGAAPSPSDIESSIMTTTTNGGRRKKRKGALTSQSGYSMTSSSLVRTEQLGILDARFDKIEDEYIADMDDMGSVSAVSTASTVNGPMRSDFDSVLDDFLGGYSTMGKKHIRKGGWKSGTEQLDEIRRELGPARVRSRGTPKKAVK